MDNATKHAFGGAANSEFVIDPDGVIVRLRSWSDPDALRSDLEELVGPVEIPTTVDQLDMPSQGVDEPAARGIVKRLDLPTGLQPIQMRPATSDEPYYAKLRAEATRGLIREDAVRSTWASTSTPCITSTGTTLLIRSLTESTCPTVGRSRHRKETGRM